MKFFGKSYDDAEIREVCDAFYDPAKLIVHTRYAVKLLVSRKEWDRRSGEKARRRSWEPPRVARHIDTLHLDLRLKRAREAINRYRPALHVAQNGPLFSPSGRSEERTVFDYVLDGLAPIINDLASAKHEAWHPDHRNAWDALSLDDRHSSVYPLLLAARQHERSVVITTDITMRIAEMWKYARVANRLISTLGQAHESLLEGSLVIAKLGFLVHKSPNYGTIESGYPKAEKFPTCLEADEWRELASLIRRLGEIAHQAGLSNDAVIDALAPAESLAEIVAHYAESGWDQDAVDAETEKLDRLAYTKAYRRIRNGISDKLRNLIPDRGVIWAEVFGRWADDVSTQDRAAKAMLLPSIARNSGSTGVSNTEVLIGLDHPASDVAPQTASVTATTGNKPAKPTRRRGRPQERDPDRDRRIAEAMEQQRNRAAVAQHFGITAREVGNAQARHRARRNKSCQET